AGRTYSIAIDVRHSRDIRNAVHDVRINLAGPIARNLIDELLTVSERTSRVGGKHYIARSSEKRGVPSVAPRIVPRALRPAVNQHDQRPLFACGEIGRFGDESVHPGSARAVPRDFFGRLQIQLRQLSVVRLRELSESRAGGAGFVDIDGTSEALPGEHQSAAVGAHLNVVIEPIVDQPLDWTAGNRQLINRLPSVIQSEEVDLL